MTPDALEGVWEGVSLHGEDGDVVLVLRGECPCVVGWCLTRHALRDVEADGSPEFVGVVLGLGPVEVVCEDGHCLGALRAEVRNDRAFNLTDEAVVLEWPRASGGHFVYCAGGVLLSKDPGDVRRVVFFVYVGACGFGCYEVVRVCVIDGRSEYRAL